MQCGVEHANCFACVENRKPEPCWSGATTGEAGQEPLTILEPAPRAELANKMVSELTPILPTRTILRCTNVYTIIILLLVLFKL